MRSVLVLLILATLTAACGKKQPPAAPAAAPPADEKAQDADKATGGAPAPDTEATPRAADPCEGGENK